MNEFRLWAPLAHDVKLRVSDSAYAMEPDKDGWWRFRLLESGAGMDYFFLLGDGEPLPDPRSPWQPYGVHGPSRLVDHSAFSWTDRQWQAPHFASAIVYELHIGTFTPEGTFDSAVSRLGYLADLGITHVELMPVQEFSGEWGWGYDGVDLFAPHHAYGGPEALQRLVDACHAAGLAVLLDVVYNHLGPSGNYLGRFGPYFSDKYSSPWGPALNFDGPGSNEVRRFLCDNALMWLRDYHFDGLRIDAIHAVYDSSAVHFLEMLAEEVEQLQAHTGRNMVLIAESNLNDPRAVTPREAGGYGLDAQWSDDFHHALHVALTGERTGYYIDFNGLADLAKSLGSVFVYDGRYSVFRKRNHGRAPAGFSGSRFLGYLQNHDQVGNRAKGERSSQLMSTGKLKIGAALVLCAPFVPMLFQGEEFAASTPFCYFTQHPEPELARSVSAGRRQEFAEFGWRADEVPDPQDPSTFVRSKLAWDELALAPHAEVLDWYRRLIALRRTIPALTDGRLKDVNIQFDEQNRWIRMRRGPVCVIANLAQKRQAVPDTSSWEMLLASEPHCCLTNNMIELPPDSVVVLQSAKGAVRDSAYL